jgi:ABC-type multidrug transport system ATPase subunit
MAGKSTLMKMTTYINADEGDALVNGHSKHQPESGTTCY